MLIWSSSSRSIRPMALSWSSSALRSCITRLGTSLQEHNALDDQLNAIGRMERDLDDQITPLGDAEKDQRVIAEAAEVLRSASRSRRRGASSKRCC